MAHQEQSNSFPPDLSYSEELYRCGYSPRAMHLDVSETESILFVGCKDGSLWKIRWTKGGPEALHEVTFQREGVRDEHPAGIRSLFGMDEWLLIGRNNGEIGLLDLSSEANEYRQIGDEITWLEARREKHSRDFDRRENSSDMPRYGGSVRTIGKLDKRRVFISFRKLGTLVATLPSAVTNADSVEEAIQTALDNGTYIRVQRKERDHFRGLRVAVRLTTPEEKEWIWLLVDEEGSLFHWSGDIDEPVEPLDDLWPRGEHPVLVNDYAPVRGRPQKRSRGLFLATDLGVHYLELKKRNEHGQPEMAITRMSLPGLGAICMALTYVEDRKTQDDSAESFRFLWAVDTRGDSHLFCDERDADRPNLRPSGFSHLGSQVMSAVADRKGGRVTKGGLLYCAQIRRDDQVAIGSYRLVSSASRIKKGIGVRQRARKILSASSFLGVARYLLKDEERQGLTPLENKESPRPSESIYWRDAPRDWNETYLVAALISDFVQSVAQVPETREVLEEFLSNPNANETGQFLNSIEEFSDIMKTLDLWTTSFLGVIHRYLARDPSTGQASSERAQRFSLGLLRWLEKLEKRAHEASQSPEVLHRLETCARMVRKWGLFSHEVGRRESLSVPIRVMRQGGRPSGVPAGQRVDLLTHESLLFARGVDLLYEENRHRMDGRSAWSVDSTRLQKTAGGETSHWLAVAWNWGGIEIYQVCDPSKNASGMLHLEAVVSSERGPDGSLAPKIESCRGDRDSMYATKTIQREKYGYSRAICLRPSVDNESLLLLFNVAHAREEGVCEKLFLFKIPFRDKRLDCPKNPTSFADLPGPKGRQPGESVYSLLHLGDYRFLAGLRGTGGLARVQGFFIKDDRLEAMGKAVDAPRGIRMEQSDTADPSRDEDSDRSPYILQNRVWSLARPWEPDPEDGSPRGQKGPTDRYEVLVGCENGEIRLLTWSAGENLEQDSEKSELRFDVVARLGAAVEALAFRKSYDDARIPSRIFAGGEDGAIVAWQERYPSPQNKEELPFAPLWATVEGGAVSHVQLWPYQNDDPKAPPVLVVAINRDGTAVIFDDRSQPHRVQTETPSRPKRIQFPGNRHSRPSLGSSALAAGLWNYQTLGIKMPPEDVGGLPALGAIVCATSDGRIRLLGLDHPRYTPKRRDKYLELVKRWWDAARNKPVKVAAKTSTRSLRDWEYQFHLCDTVLGATPFLALILVRWLLDPSLDKRFGPVPEGLEGRDFETMASEQPNRIWWQLPRYLRPLLGMRLAWDLEKPDSRAAGEFLEKALRTAHDLGDIHLFKEICEVTLKRANFHLFRTGAQEDSNGHHRAVQELYFKIFEAIEQALESWRGAPDRAERRVRVVVAKHLVDGDTFLKVLERAGQEENDRGEKSQREPDGPFSEILSKRMVGIRQLIFARDPIVSLEALRAANLSLTRLCRRLVVRREEARTSHENQEWVPRTRGETSNYEVRWEEFRLYFRQLTFAAAQAYQSSAELSATLAHEFARTFALAVCICPSATIRIANRMTETRLITDLDSDQDLCHQVQRQMEILGTIGLSVPSTAQDWFKLVTRGPSSEDGWFPTSRELAGLLTDEGDWEEASLESFEQGVAHQVGLQNSQDLFCLYHLRGALQWLENLTFAMTEEATEFDLTKSTFEDAEKRLQRLNEEGVQSLYAESARFWHESFKELEAADPPQNPIFLEKSFDISHRALLVSSRIEKWARRRLKALESYYKKQEIFQPEYAIFKGILSRLEDAARGFARSAAVQKAVVTAILGHHLLEDLDEHIFELEEIAMVLDPIQVQEYRESGQREMLEYEGSSRARLFSSYLLRRAQSAESLPKNLRMLYGLLESGESHKATFSIEDLLEPYKDWEPSDLADSFELSPEEAAHLDLVFEELQQNHLKHSVVRKSSNSKNRDSPSITTNDSESKDDTTTTSVKLASPKVQFLHKEEALELTFEFWEDPEDPEDPDNCNRLLQLQEAHCDHPISPSSDRTISSSGAGLYLASLSAAVVGWKLQIEDVQCGSEASAGKLIFRLEKLKTD